MTRAVFRAGLLFLLVAVGPAPAAELAPRLRLLVPAYFYPAGQGLKDWDRLLAAAAQVPVLAVVNPASGPGAKADPAYTKLLDRARKQAGLTLLGYVSTRYGKRPAAEVKADVDRWLRLYPQIQGIFFDEQASDAGRVDYYADLYAHVRRVRKLRRVVTNPGTVCAEGYLARPATDVACLFEGGSGFDRFRRPAWARRSGPGAVAVLAYGIGAEGAMRRALTAAVAQGVGCVYVTDATGANPWDRLPAYWDKEVAAVKQVNRPARGSGER